jgi:hypothetical protein
VSRCWHLLGLPPDRQIRLAAFKQLQDAGDAPFKAQIAMIDAQIAALEDSPTVPPSDETADAREIADDMRALEAQFHPGYDYRIILTFLTPPLLSSLMLRLLTIPLLLTLLMRMPHHLTCS